MQLRQLMASREAPISTPAFLDGGGEMGARIRAHDWSATPFGPPSRWPNELRVAVSICLHSSFPTAIYWGGDLRLLYNDAWAPIPADKHPWALGRPAREVWSDIWRVIEPQFAKVLEERQGFSTFDQLLHMERRGRIEETYWNYSFTPIRDDQGRVLGILNQGHETTGRVLAEREHALEIERLRELFEQAPGAVTVLRGPQHVYELANPAYLELIGRRDIIGKRVADVLPEVAGQGFIDLLDNVYRKGETYVGESRVIRLQRRPEAPAEDRYVDFVFQPIKDRTGRTEGIFVQATDVTERAEVASALRASEENLRRLNERLEALVQERTEELSTAISTLQTLVNRMRATVQTSFSFQGYLRPDGTLLDANTASLAAIGARLEDVLGKPFWETAWFTATPGMPETISDSVAKVARGESLRRTIKVVLPAGERTFDFSMRPVMSEQGEVIGLLPEAVDLTPLMQAEERLRQSQKMEAIGQLTGGIAHDFNNLLTGIIGSLDLMEKRLAQGRNDKVADYAKAAVAAANRAAALTHRLLAFARRQPLDPTPVAANALIAEMEDMLRRTLGENIRLEVLESGNLWLTNCDANQLESALLNLVINARDAMPRGGRICIETSNVTIAENDARGVAPGQYVSICVSDTGVGMSPEVIEKAFDPFFTTKPLGKGTGLGLSMTYGFVRQSGGDVTIRSRVDEGSSVCLFLPRYRGEHAFARRGGEETGPYRTLADRTVLVVEDDHIVRHLILDVLGELGLSALEASDGATGRALLDSDARIDLLITDIGLPEVNGRDLANGARRRRPLLKILLITGYAEHVDSGVGGLDRDMQILTKPFTLEALTQRIHGMLDG
jgi:signal transduction histidine kinase